MSLLEQRATELLGEAFCRLRYFARRPLNEDGRRYLFHLADAAHNIPAGLAGDPYHQPYLARDVEALEALLSEPYEIATQRYCSYSPSGRGGLRLFAALPVIYAAVGCALIASGFAFLTGDLVKGGLFAACAAVLSVWASQARKPALPSGSARTSALGE